METARDNCIHLSIFYRPVTLRVPRVHWMVVAAIAVALSLVPIVRMIHFIATTGVNTASADDVVFIPLISHILSGHYNWQNYFRDTLIARSQSFAIPMLIRLAVIKLTHWNMYVELYIGVAVAVLRLALTYIALTYTARSRGRWLMLPVLAALVFSASQADDFTFGQTTDQVGITQLGLAMGIWGLVRYRDRWSGIAVMSLGGALATLSAGSGLAVWPSFLAGMVLLGFRRPWTYIAWLSAAVVSSLPYIWYRLVEPLPWAGMTAQIPYPSPAIGSLFAWRYLLAVLGRPFTESNSAVMAVMAGALGVVLVIAAAAILLLRRPRGWLPAVAPAAMLIIDGLANTWMISVARQGLNVWGPWHAGYAIPFWIGLLGLAYVLWILGGACKPYRLWAFAAVYTITFLYVPTNVTFDDKVTFVRSRAPASASCIRNYAVAPGSCENYVFTWAPGHPGWVSLLGRTLQRYDLSVFAPQQQWTLQGDFGLGSVRIRRIGRGQVFWSEGVDAVPIHWYDYHHLNLYLRAGNVLSWTVHFPVSLRRADLVTAVSREGPKGQRAATIVVQPANGIGGETVRPRLRTSGWQSVNMPLTRFAGQTVTIRLVPSAAGPPSWFVFRYPVIDVSIGAGGTGQAEAAAGPTPVPTRRDYRLYPGNRRAWRSLDMRQIQAAPNPSWIAGAEPALIFRQQLNVCLSRYRYLYIREAAARALYPRAVQVVYRLRHETGFDDNRGISIPLYPDGATHTYTYDLRLLELPPDAHLTVLAIYPVGTAPRVDAPVRQSAKHVSITDFRFIPGAGTTACGGAQPRSGRLEPKPVDAAPPAVATN